MKGPKEKKERALGERLHLKGHRCDSPKCAAVRKPYRPGMHGRKTQRKSVSDFGRQIREKQKFKLTYGINEKGLRKLFFEAQQKKGSTSLKLMELLERRLDNVLFRLGFAPSRAASRQLLVHGHILVNKKRVRAPGFVVSAGDAIEFRAESKSKGAFKELAEAIKKYEPPAWLALDKEKMEGKVLSLPKEMESLFDTGLLVESFSK